jgi:hypothetical protein
VRAFAEVAAAEEMMFELLSIGSGGQPESNLVLLPLLQGGSNMAGWPVFGCGEIGYGCGVCACFLCSLIISTERSRCPASTKPAISPATIAADDEPNPRA